MDRDDNILRKIRDILGNSADNFSILEHQVDVAVQMEYFEFSRNHNPSEDIYSTLEQEKELYDPNIDTNEKKALLVNLASIDKPEAFRIIQRYLPLAQQELKDWASMALQESRMLLESKLLDEQQIFISTGLGGKEGKLRYFVVIFSSSGEEFSQTQKDLVKSEFTFILRKYNALVEDISFHGNHSALLALVPLNVPVKEPFDAAINECNSLSEFIQSGFIITNVKKLSPEEVDEILKNPPPSYLEIDT